jgi:hypothetical protein
MRGSRDVLCRIVVRRAAALPEAFKAQQAAAFGCTHVLAGTLRFLSRASLDLGWLSLWLNCENTVTDSGSA